MPLGQFVDEDDATAHRMMDINVHGVLYGMKLAMPGMIRRNSGHIVNIASQAGKGGFPGGATYCATKHAVVGVSEAVRAELTDTEIEVSCVMPAVVNTELAAGLKEARGVKNQEPEDVADAIVKALEYPKFDVYVPAYAGGIAKFMQLLPRGGREAAARALGADKVLADADSAQRAAYEDRGGPVGAGPRARGRRGRGRDQVGIRRRGSGLGAPERGQHILRRRARHPVPRRVRGRADVREQGGALSAEELWRHLGLVLEHVSPAPPIAPSASAAASAAESTRGPREVFTRIAWSGIASSSGSPMRCRVSGVAGAWRLTTSARPSASGSSALTAPSSSSASGFAERAT